MNPFQFHLLPLVILVATALTASCGKKQTTLAPSVASSIDGAGYAKDDPPTSFEPQRLKDCGATQNAEVPAQYTIKCRLPNITAPVVSIPTSSTPNMATIKVTSGTTNIQSADVSFDSETSSLLILAAKMKSSETLVIVFNTVPPTVKDPEQKTCVTARQLWDDQVRAIDGLDKSCTSDIDCVAFGSNPADSCPQVFYTNTTSLESKKADLTKVLSDVVRECPKPQFYCAQVFRLPRCVFDVKVSSSRGQCKASP